MSSGPLSRSMLLISKIGTVGRATWAALMVVMAVVPSITAAAQDVGSTVSLAAKVADGRPWRMRTDDGRATTLVLFVDGTGTMTGGPMPLSPKWRATAGGMCLKPGALLAERCVTLRPIEGGFVGSRDGTVLFTLRR